VCVCVCVCVVVLVSSAKIWDRRRGGDQVCPHSGFACDML
jgi:hypothetical protein